MQEKKRNLVFEKVKESAYPDIAKHIIDFAADQRVLIFIGNLGAGKTTLIKHITKALGIEDIVQSPTFALVNQYGANIYHFDCYRLNSTIEALDFGIEEYLDSGKYCLIEWPEIIEDLLPLERVEIRISHEQNQTRTIEIIKT